MSRVSGISGISGISGMISGMISGIRFQVSGLGGYRVWVFGNWDRRGRETEKGNVSVKRFNEIVLARMKKLASVIYADS